MGAAEINLNGIDWQIKGYLGADWEDRHACDRILKDRRGWLPATVPGSIQNDLWQVGEVPDPYFERNSLLLEWIPQRTWVYRKTFQVPMEWKGRRNTLVFEGVDYQAAFYLNGQFLGEHLGMYTPVQFDVSDLLDYSGENVLAVSVAPAPVEQPQVGRTSQVRTHKARMNYWWDFCPRMIHVGIWDRVSLRSSGNLKLEDIFVQPALSEDLAQADISVKVELSSTVNTIASLNIVVKGLDGSVARHDSLKHPVIAGVNQLAIRFRLEKPSVWWPNGSGDQPLYKLEVGVSEGSDEDLSVSDCQEVLFGIRKIEFCQVQGASQDSLAYQLVVNNRPIYIQGWNWVPMDVLYGVERPDKLEYLLQLARDAHVNLLRVWGGGLIEKEAFYRLCDQLGILVWQEFIQSSSGVENCPPDAPEFLLELEHEARQIIPRRRNHPSLALWVGGNELMTAAGLPANEEHPNLRMLRRVVQELDPGRAWLPTSPSGPVFGFTLHNLEADPSRLHDVHGPWEFQGLIAQQELYNQGASQLHSEFGVEGITNWHTLEATLSPEHRWPVNLDNPAWFHLGAWWVKLPVWQEAFGGKLDNLEKTQQAAQLLQADGLRYAVEADRRRQPFNAGSLPWQFNEPYPMAACTSSVDYYARPKSAYYAVAAAYEPLHVSARFPRVAWKDQVNFTATVWASNACPEAVEGVAITACIRDARGLVMRSWNTTLNLPPGTSLPAIELDWIIENLDENLFWLDLSMASGDGRELSANRYLFSRTNDLAPLFDLPDTQVEVSQAVDGDHWKLVVKNTGNVVALFSWIEDGRPVRSAGFARVKQNYFCIFPGEQRFVDVEWVSAQPTERCLELHGWNFKGWFIDANNTTQQNH